MVPVADRRAVELPRIATEDKTRRRPDLPLSITAAACMRRTSFLRASLGTKDKKRKSLCKVHSAGFDEKHPVVRGGEGLFFPLSLLPRCPTQLASTAICTQHLP